MVAQQQHKWTPEAYLAFERTSETRHEYLNGEIYDMTGASMRHNRIAGNTFASLHAQLSDRPCDVFQSDMRLKATPQMYTYPDVSVVCGEPQLSDDKLDTLLNPTVIIEVLSPSTENYDRGEKFRGYRTLNSLQEYLLISQDKVSIEHYVRQGDQWVLSDTTDPEAILKLPSVGCTLTLADVYKKISFEPESSD